MRDRLKLDWLTPLRQAVPFGLTGVAESDWTATGLESNSSKAWKLSARSVQGLEAVWNLRFFEDTRAVECWGEVVHRGAEPVRGITESLALDVRLPLALAAGAPWVRLFNGAWSVPHYFPPQDFAPLDVQLVNTSQVYSRLTAAAAEDGRVSATHLPCAFLCDALQQHGLGLFLEWAGLWRISFGQSAYPKPTQPEPVEVHLQAGLRGLNLDLLPGQSLPIPRALLVAFDGDFQVGGNALRRHIRRHVTPKLGGREVLPATSFNHWFAFSNTFTAASMKPAVDACAELGLEYFCVDGGWHRGGFRSGIGDWEPDPAKFPDGIAPFADYVRSRGLRYGTWFEPEWAHVNSPLYRQHPDWFWPTPADTQPWQTATNWNFIANGHLAGPQYALLNLGCPEARQWLLKLIVRVYETWGVRWIRWDFNQAPRPNWDDGVPSGERGWRQLAHVQGLYAVLDDILAACPDLFVEQCSGGGNRIELGAVRRGHAFWMNDHTTQSDIVRALQHGLNQVLPGNYANTNLCQNRHDYTDYDFLSHGAGSMGYSGRIWEASREEFVRLKEAFARFKSYRHLLLGDYERVTGCPRRADAPCEVRFREGRESLCLSFNSPGGTGRIFKAGENVPTTSGCGPTPTSMRNDAP